MKKNLLLLLMISSITLLSGCVGSSSTDSSDTDLQNNEVVSVVSTGANLPICGEGSQAMPTSIISIEDNVKNCTTQEYQGKSLDGVDFICPPTYSLHQGQIIEYSLPCPDHYNADNAICVTKEKNSKAIYVDDILTGYTDIRQGLDSQLIDYISADFGFSEIHCAEGSAHCKDLKDKGSWSDGINYFIAGYRYNDPQEYYVINNKIYSPGKTDWKDYSDPNSHSAWIFGGINESNNTIIVHKATNLQIAYQENGDVTNSYTLTTCEIDM